MRRLTAVGSCDVEANLARLRLGLIASYYRRVILGAWRETTRLLPARLAISVSLLLLSFLVSVLVDRHNTGGTVVTTLIAVVALWLVVFVWYCVTIPPRIEADVRMRTRDIEVVQLRVSLVNAMRSKANECRMAAQRARAAVLRAEHTGEPVDLDMIHTQAVDVVTSTEEVLKSHEERLRPYTGEITALSRAVDGAKPATADEAIEQLLRLAAVIDDQIYTGRYES